MTITLHLGVTDIPYAWGAKASGGISAAKAQKAAKSKTPPPSSGAGKTTGEVAEILEQKYGLFTKFVEIHRPVIEYEVSNSLEGAMETILTGHMPSDPLATAKSGIEELFKDALTMQSYDYKIPGVPTGAAQRGVRHSFKRSYLSSRGPRPSFVDTGLFRDSFRCWTDE